MANSRTKNTLLNSIFGMIGYISVIVVSFVLRKVLAVVLNAEYLGLYQPVHKHSFLFVAYRAWTYNRNNLFFV